MDTEQSFFRYSKVDWAKIREFGTAKTASAARRDLESAGSRYLLSMLHPNRTQSAKLIIEYEKRQKIANKAREFLYEIEQVGVSASTPYIRASDIGLGRRWMNGTVSELLERSASADLDEIRYQLGLMVAWIEADKLDFFPKSSNAHKPAKSYLVWRALKVWETTFERKIPRGGGNPRGPTASYLQASCNPILARGTDGRIANGEQARQLIIAYVKNRSK